MPSKVWSLEVNGKPFIATQQGPRQFRIVFDISIWPGDFLSLADIQIYNLAEDTTIDRRSTIVLRAGDDSREDIIFIGSVTNVFRERSPGDTATRLHVICKSGVPATDRSSIRKSFGRGIGVLDVLKELAAAWFIPLDVEESQFADAPVMARGLVVDGDIPTIMDSLAYAYGFNWVQELGRLIVTKPSAERTVMGVIKVNQYTGMIGMPEVTRGPQGLGIFVSVYLNPFVRINGKIDVLSNYSTFNTGNLYLQETEADATANGEYNVIAIHHRGDSHGDLWESSIDGIRAGTLAPEEVLAGDALVWGQKVNDEFRAKVRTICKVLGFDPNWLMAVMAYETKWTLSPSKRNKTPGSTATGLIQFLESTARRLNTTTQKLARMTGVEQLDYVAEYFSPYAGRINNLGDCYMAVLWPAAMGRLDSYVMWERDSGPYQKEYQVNKHLDINGDGKITRGEACSVVVQSLENGRNYAE